MAQFPEHAGLEPNSIVFFVFCFFPFPFPCISLALFHHGEEEAAPELILVFIFLFSVIFCALLSVSLFILRWCWGRFISWRSWEVVKIVERNSGGVGLFRISNLALELGLMSSL